MSDDFGTVSAKQGERSREIELLRQRYRRHREALQRMIPDAPTEHLADAYSQVTAEIDDALRKLDEMEGRAPTVPPSSTPGDRPLERNTFDDVPPPAAGSAMPRMLMIIVAGIIVVGVIAYLMWHAAQDKKGTRIVTETTSTSDTAAASTVAAVTPAPATITPVATPASGIKIMPALNDYGTIRKGTRAVRPFDVLNSGSDPITIQVSRSSCRCLFYEYRDKIAPKKKETITVAIDGARAKVGALHETVTVTAKEDPSITAQFVVEANIK